LNEYNPICIDGITYFSACHAGCEKDIRDPDKTGIFDVGKCHCAQNDMATDLLNKAMKIT